MQRFLRETAQGVGRRSSVRWRILRLAGTLALLGALAAPGSAQQISPAGPVPGNEFRFIRLAYTEYSGGYGEFRGWRRSWTIDSPEAETHLLQGIRRLTRVDTGPEGGWLRPADPAIFEYPFLYAVEVGHWHLSDQDAALLREYLLRGGFLVVDDFHGTQEWEVFVESMRRVFPDRPIIELGEDHPIFHQHFDVDHRVQIPGIRGAITGQHWEKDGFVPHWRAIFDDEGRVMVMINHNMDLGDAWEHADNPQYPAELTTLAYYFAVNYLLYDFTH